MFLSMILDCDIFATVLDSSVTTHVHGVYKLGSWVRCCMVMFKFVEISVCFASLYAHEWKAWPYWPCLTVSTLWWKPSEQVELIILYLEWHKRVSENLSDQTFPSLCWLQGPVLYCYDFGSSPQVIYFCIS